MNLPSFTSHARAWFARAYFLQGFLMGFVAVNVFGDTLVWLLTAPGGLKALWTLNLIMGAFLGLVNGFGWSDARHRADRYNAMDAQLRARYEDDRNVARYNTFGGYCIKLWLRRTADFASYPREIEDAEGRAWSVELIVWRG